MKLLKLLALREGFQRLWVLNLKSPPGPRNLHKIPGQSRDEELDSGRDVSDLEVVTPKHLPSFFINLSTGSLQHRIT